MDFWSAILIYPLTLDHRRERHEGVKQRFARFCLRCGSRAVTLDSIYARLCLESGIERSAHREPVPMPVNQIALKPAGFMVKSRQVLRSALYLFLILARATQRDSFFIDMGVSSAFYLPVNQSLTVNSPVVCRKRTKLRMRYRNDDFEKNKSLDINFFPLLIDTDVALATIFKNVADATIYQSTKIDLKQKDCCDEKTYFPQNTPGFYFD